jgi:lipopolysaccharide transport system ATP-binding protein
MRKHEITRKLDEIIDFSGCDRYIDTPVKRYSSGMYVRLAFAVAAHLDPEILIVDEVLAVGDTEFQKKCLGKMKDVASNGRTVLFVSHHMQSVKVLCNRGMYLERGRIAHVGSVDNAIDLYVGSFSRPKVTHQDPDRRPGSGEYRFTHVAPSKEMFSCAEEKIVSFTIEQRSPFTGKIFLSAHIVNSAGVIVVHCDSRMVETWIEPERMIRGKFSFRTPWLKPGDYRVEMFICSAGVLDRYEEACTLSVNPLLPYPAAGNDEATANGVVFCDFAYKTELH